MSTRLHGRLVRRSVALVVAVVLFAAACSSDSKPSSSAGSGGSSAAPASGEPYKVGVLLPLSGKTAGVGTSFNVVFQAYADYVNNVEGGINGHPIELVVQDDGGDTTRTVAAYRAFADQGVSAVLGIPLSSSVPAATDVANETKLTFVNVAAVPSILRENPPYAFQSGATTGSDAEPMARFATDLMAGKKTGDIRVALVPHDSPSAVEWADTIKNVWGPKLGLTVTADVTVPLAAADVTSQVQEVVSSNPDVVMITNLDTNLPALVNRLRVLGFQGPVVFYHGAGSDANLSTLNDPNVFAMREFRSLDEDASKFPGLARLKAVIERAGQKVADQVRNNVISYLAAGGFLVTEGTLKACSFPCNAAAFNAAITNLKVDTQGLTGGNIEFSPTDHQGSTESVFYHFIGGKLVAANDGKAYHGDVYTMVTG